MCEAYVAARRRINCDSRQSNATNATELLRQGWGCRLLTILRGLKGVLDRVPNGKIGCPRPTNWA
jgi:hypothetical protein